MRLSNAYKGVWKKLFSKTSPNAFSYPIWTTKELEAVSWREIYNLELNEWKSWLLRVSGNEIEKVSVFLKSSATEVLRLLNNRLEDYQKAQAEAKAAEAKARR